jgi:uncharacterized membrane protein YqjE
MSGRSPGIAGFSDLDDPTQPKRPERSLGELISEMGSELGTLMRQEVELAKLETRQELTKTARSAGMLGAAALAGWMALVMVSFAAAWLLDQAINTALAFAIVGMAWALVGAVLYGSGKKKLAQVEPLPQTTETLKEDMEWLKAQKN